MSEEELSAWLRLLCTEGIDSARARRLLMEFGLPQHIFAATLVQLERVVPGHLAKALFLAPGEFITDQIEKTKAWINIKGNHVITLGDPHYPASLLDIADPPVMLWVSGRVQLLSSPSFAITGSKSATHQGTLDSRRFAQALGNAGYTIVSGMNPGIDVAAHMGALNTASSTVAVLATGADITVPPQNTILATRIAEEGCLISEVPLGTPLLKENAAKRMRIISGLSRGLLVVEAELYSNSMTAAHIAVEQSKEVFAVPGSIHSALSRGPHRLIRQGAKLVETEKDILEEISPASAKSK